MRRRPPNLPDAMRAAATDPARERTFRQALHAATVLLPQSGTDDGGGVRIPVVEHGGRPVVPVYSSQEALQRAHPEGTAYVAVRVADLQARWRDGVGMAVDLGAGLGTVLSDADVRALPDAPRVRPVHVGADEEFAIGEPRADITALRRALATHLATVPEVHAAHLALVAFPGQPPQLVLGLVCSPGTRVPDMARELPDVPTPHPLSAVAIDVDAPGTLGAALLEHPDMLAGRPS